VDHGNLQRQKHNATGSNKMMDTTEKNLTLYQQHHVVFDTLKNRFPNIFALSQIVRTVAQMDDAVGSLGGGCSIKWIRGNNVPGMGSERRAAAYLWRLANDQPSLPAMEPAPATKLASMFLISVPENAKAKAEMLLNMLRNIGCEVVDF
jgi:hypothetical protein